MEMKDSQGNPNGPNPPDFEESKEKLLEGIEAGEANFSMNTYINSQEDGEKGIFNTVMDIVGKPMVNPIDVNFVLDVSGSMNMWGDHTYTPLVPDLNPDYYYKIPKGVFNASEDIYIKFQDYGPIRSWDKLTKSWWDKMFAANGLSGRRNVGDWKPWNNLYKKDGDTYVHLPMNPRYKYDSL